MPIYASLKKSGEKVYDAVTRVPKLKGGTRQIQKRFKLKKHAQQWIDKMSVDVTEGTFRELKKGTFFQFVEDFWKPTYLIPFHLTPPKISGNLIAFSPLAIYDLIKTS